MHNAIQYRSSLIYNLSTYSSLVILEIEYSNVAVLELRITAVRQEFFYSYIDLCYIELDDRRLIIHYLIDRCVSVNEYCRTCTTVLDLHSKVVFCRKSS